MAKAKNHRSIVNAGEHIGRALSPKELLVIASVVQAAMATADDGDSKTLKLAYAKLRAGQKWKTLNTKTRGV